MHEGWKCPKCNNIYAPATPFCLYCWFQNNNKIQLSLQKQNEFFLNNNINTDKNFNRPSNQQKITKISTQPINLNEINKSEIYTNKNLQLEHVEIIIPTLNKLSNYSQSQQYPDTKIYLGGIGHSKERAIHRKFRIPYILDSIIDFPIQPSKLVRQYFDYLEKQNIEYLLDSGAFSYMNNPKKAFNLNQHLKQYCYYINEFNINNFMELDLDIFMSLEQVENIRRKIYLQTHKKPIIVYHSERGYNYWTQMIKENDFVAIGGLVVDKEIQSPERQQQLQDMCEEAHAYNTHVHGLGFTPLSLLNSHTMFFDTVDSTSWNFTMRGFSAILNQKGEIVKAPPIQTFSAVESQEEDLKTWAQFANNYKGAKKI